MIRRHEMFAPLLAAYPAFKAQHDAFMNDWTDDKEGSPNYLLLADLARECSILLADDKELEVKRIFGVVEDWLLDGDEYVQEAAAVGFLEDIQNTNLHKGKAPEDFRPFCGPEALFWWEKVARFWSHGEAIRDTRRSECNDKQ